MACKIQFRSFTVVALLVCLCSATDFEQQHDSGELTGSEAKAYVASDGSDIGMPVRKKRLVSIAYKRRTYLWHLKTVIL